MPIALMICESWKSQGGAATVSFSPLGLAYHVAHSLGFWVSIIVLFPGKQLADVATEIGEHLRDRFFRPV